MLRLQFKLPSFRYKSIVQVIPINRLLRGSIVGAIVIIAMSNIKIKMRYFVETHLCKLVVCDTPNARITGCVPCYCPRHEQKRPVMRTGHASPGLRSI